MRAAAARGFSGCSFFLPQPRTCSLLRSTVSCIPRLCGVPRLRVSAIPCAPRSFVSTVSLLTHPRTLSDASASRALPAREQEDSQGLASPSAYSPSPICPRPLSLVAFFPAFSLRRPRSRCIPDLSPSPLSSPFCRPHTPFFLPPHRPPLRVSLASLPDPAAVSNALGLPPPGFLLSRSAFSPGTPPAVILS